MGTYDVILYGIVLYFIYLLINKRLECIGWMLDEDKANNTVNYVTSIIWYI